jgi:hypothetical protein
MNLKMAKAIRLNIPEPFLLRADIIVDGRMWHIASFRCDAEFGRDRGKANIDDVAPIKLD